MVFGSERTRKEKRKGPCHHCGEKESTQWRIGPAHAPTLCNACGVHWGRKKKLPQHRVPQTPARLKRELPTYTLSEMSESSDESKAAETLIELSLTTAVPRQKRRQTTVPGARSTASDSEPDALFFAGPLTSRENDVADASDAEADTELISGTHRSVEHTESFRAHALAASSAVGQCGMLTEAAVARYAVGTAQSLTSVCQTTPVLSEAVVSAQPPALPPTSAFLHGASAWPLSFSMPTAFDVFRADWNAAHPSSGWSDARRVWETLPADVVCMYQRQANAALSATPCPPFSVQFFQACSSLDITPETPLSASIIRSQQIAACLAN